MRVPRRKSAANHHHIPTMLPVSAEEVGLARRSCAHGCCEADLGEVLEMLGIGPDWPEHWVGPVATDGRLR